MSRSVRNADEDVYGRLGGLEMRVDHIESTLTAHGAKLDRVLDAVSGHPKFDPVRILQTVAFLVGLAAAGGTAITYVASTTNAGRIAVLEFQTQEVWRAGHWAPNMTVQAKTQ